MGKGRGIQPRTSDLPVLPVHHVGGALHLGPPVAGAPRVDDVLVVAALELPLDVVAHGVRMKGE